MKVVLYKGTHRLEVIGRIKRLSPEHGILLEDVMSVRGSDRKDFVAAKTLFEGRWVKKYVTIKALPDEVVLGMKL